MSTPDAKSASKQSETFIARWSARDRTCMPAAPGALVTVPYPGLRSFKPELNQFFFGRERQKRELKAFFSDGSRGPDGRRRVTFVVGGSGSGKSSLTLAGLIAELNTISMPELSGAWYVAQTRPEKDPIAQLLLALNRIVLTNVDLAVQRARKEGGDEQVGKRVLEIAKALGSTDTRDPDELKKDLVGRLCSELAPLPAGKTQPTLDMLALFGFVEGTLDKLDAVMALPNQRSGKPSLLIHIDQFEEVFREETDRVGREALMHLLRSVYEYAPQHLFVVATMRSEELHKCSEYEGIAEVVNNSMYLIDLVSQDEIQKAIVDPARRAATLWELPVKPSATAPFTPEAVRLLQQAYQEAGAAIEHTADQLPLLQHCLPLAWEAAVDDWISRRRSDAGAKLEITREILESIPGWVSANAASQQSDPAPRSRTSEWLSPTTPELGKSRLGRCLDAHAQAVLISAAGKWVSADGRPAPPLAVYNVGSPKAAFGDVPTEFAGLIAAFCCLAQLDDRGRAVRRFVTLNDIVRASGLPEWTSTKYSSDVLSKRVQTALGEFERAGFIERIGATEGTRYNVSHEAFVRNWTSYERWLNEKQFVQQRIRESAKRAVRLSREPMNWNPIDWILASRKRDAYAIIPDETGSRLRCVFGERPIFSRTWAQKILQDQSASGIAAKAALENISPEERLNAIREIWKDSGWWQDHGRTRQATAGALFMLFVIAAGMLWLFLAQKSKLAEANADLARRNGDSAYQLRNLLIAVQTFSANFPTSVQLREVQISNRLAYESASSKSLSDNKEAMRVLRKTFYQSDFGLRRYLSGTSILFEDDWPASKRPRPEDLKDAVCRVAEEDAAPIKVKRPDGGELGVAALFGTLWIPGADDALAKPSIGEKGYFGGIAVSPRGLICLSHDARWVLSWGSSLLPALFQIVWSQQGKEWHAKVLSQRTINLNIDQNRALFDPRFSGAFGASTDRARTGKPVQYFSKDGVVSFVMPISSNRTPRVLIWTASGLLHPDDSIQVDGKDWPWCDYKAVSARQGTGARLVSECQIPADIPGQRDISDDRQLTLAVTFGEGQCRNPSVAAEKNCASTIELRFQGIDSQEVTDNVSLRLQHNFARVTNAKLEDGWLWLYDSDRKSWRYLIGRDRFDSLLDFKYAGVAWQDTPGRRAVDNYTPSRECDDMDSFPNCKKYLEAEGSWPGPPK
jgi:hypothetical protein